jgi:hypothetical protein
MVNGSLDNKKAGKRFGLVQKEIEKLFDRGRKLGLESPIVNAAVPNVRP